MLGTMQEVTEVQGVIKAYQELENYNYNKIDDLLYAHKILMSDILTTAGTFRTSNVIFYGKHFNLEHLYKISAIFKVDMCEFFKSID